MQSLDGVDIFTLKTGKYYVGNGVNMPTEHPTGYVFVDRLLPDTATIKVIDPYSDMPYIFFNKQTASLWKGWNQYITNSDLPIFETFIPTFNNTDTVAITLQHKVIDGGHIFVTNGDFAACPVPIVGIRLPDGDRTNKVEVRFASNIVGVARINILYKPYYF